MFKNVWTIVTTIMNIKTFNHLFISIVVGMFFCHASLGSDNPWGHALAELYSDIVGQKVSIPVAFEIAANPTKPAEEIIHEFEVKTSQEHTEHTSIPGFTFQQLEEIDQVDEEILPLDVPSMTGWDSTEVEPLFPQLPSLEEPEFVPTTDISLATAQKTDGISDDVSFTAQPPEAGDKTTGQESSHPSPNTLIKDIFANSGRLADFKDPKAILSALDQNERKGMAPLSAARPPHVLRHGIRKTQTLGQSSSPPLPPLQKASSLNPTRLTRTPSRLATTVIQSIQKEPEQESAEIAVLRQLARKLTTRTLQRRFTPQELQIRTLLQSQSFGSVPASPKSTISSDLESLSPLPSPRPTKLHKSGTASLPASAEDVKQGDPLTSSDGHPAQEDLAITGSSWVLDTFVSPSRPSSLSTRSLTGSSTSSDDGGPLLDPSILQQFFGTSYVHPKKRRLLSDGGHSRDPSFGTMELLETTESSRFLTVRRPEAEPVDPAVIAEIYDRLEVTEEELQAAEHDEDLKRQVQRKLIKLIQADIIPANGYAQDPDFSPDFEALAFVFQQPDHFGDIFDITIDRYLRYVFQNFMRSSYEKAGKISAEPRHKKLPSDFRDDTVIDDSQTASIGTVDPSS